MSRRGFKEDKPKAASFFENFHLNETQLYELMANIKKDGEEKGAETFYQANKATVDAWLKG